ncbi:hypothetical protein LG202_08830 [Methylobacillus methanolivorans]
MEAPARYIETPAKFLDEVKAITGSDNQTAITLGVTRQTVSAWRYGHALPSNTHLLKMCWIAGKDFVRAVTIFEMQRDSATGDPDLWEQFHEDGGSDYLQERINGKFENTKLGDIKWKKAGFATLPLMATLSSISGLTLMTTSSLPYEALAAGLACVSSVYYVKS